MWLPIHARIKVKPEAPAGNWAAQFDGRLGERKAYSWRDPIPVHDIGFHKIPIKPWCHFTMWSHPLLDIYSYDNRTTFIPQQHFWQYAMMHQQVYFRKLNVADLSNLRES